MVSGLTIAAAFGVVALYGFPLLASFGSVVTVNVVVAMTCALVMLPPLLRAAGRREQCAGHRSASGAGGADRAGW
jgi:predicted RND superfamily exporter protein